MEHFRLLVADDSMDIRLLLERILHAPNLDVVFVANGQEAIDAFMEGKFEIILMDMEMPVLNGFEAVKRIRQLELEQGGNIVKTKIIALTGYASTEDLQKCISAGCDNVLTKPVTKHQILNIINEMG